MKRLLTCSTALWLVLASPADARTLIVGIPANLSDTAHTHVDDVMGGIYDGLQPGDDHRQAVIGAAEMSVNYLDSVRGRRNCQLH